MPNPLITLTTDFGSKDPYVAEMKAVILGLSRNATIVDISHEIEKFNIRMGAYVLASAAPYFPKDTIHVVVVDPTVGTKRRPLIIQTENAFYVGPDNGVLALTIKNQHVKHIYEITNQKLMLPKTSNTFHGRDIFAPAAAHLANGVRIEEFGEKAHPMVKPSFAKVTKMKNMLVGEVIYIDDFGNIITSFQANEIERLNIKETVKVKLKNTAFELKLRRTYAEAENQEPLAIIGSHNFLEISVNQGNAERIFNVKSGDKVVLFSPPKI